MLIIDVMLVDADKRYDTIDKLTWLTGENELDLWWDDSLGETIFPVSSQSCQQWQLWADKARKYPVSMVNYWENPGIKKWGDKLAE